jgi:hypothetical protein
MNQITEMKGWKSYVLWEGLPFLILIFLFALISTFNWGYESQLVFPVRGPGWVEIHLGLIMLSIAALQATLAAVILFVVRLTRPKSGGQWYMFIALTLVAIFLIFPAAFIVVLGPAAITMKQQMNTDSR